MDMNVTVKHNGTSVTAFVEHYTREQKICSGVGTLEVSFVNTVDRTFEPYDLIELREAGVKKGTYYVDTISKAEPDGLITVFCRDGSKKLQDYFISDNYLVDYPSNSGYWVEKFLTEAQVDYTFTTDPSGGLLSNNTSLGMSTAYDQIIPLLQMNGWYIYFNADNVAVIGKITRDISDISATLGKHDILDIKVTKSDKMLRNRVVVWGSSDPTTSSWVFSDLSTHTPWNYDNRDYRTAVISNSNIPNVSTAAIIANQALTEFARITVEKDLNVAGPKNISLGEFVFVKSNVYKGIGLVTTVGSSLSKTGFTTHLILDERCPRLFAYFNFGDYVYVSTMGSGVWRKHLEDDPMWYNYSNGLVEQRVTDLYKNNGVLSAVTASGQAYYNLEADATWMPITVSTSGLPTVLMGTDLNYSGIYDLPVTARAVIHDKLTNNIRLAVSSNLADNYMDYSTGVSIPISGSIARSWVVDYNPISETVDNTYPVHVSGFYDFYALDIENDGMFDYLTVSASGAIIGTIDRQYIFGESEGQQWNDDSKVSYSKLETMFTDYTVLNTNVFDIEYPEAICTYDTHELRAAIGFCYNAATKKRYLFGKFVNYITEVFSESYFVEIPRSSLGVAIHKITNYIYTILCVDVNIGNKYIFYTVNLIDGTCEEENSITLDKTDATASSFFGRFAEGTFRPISTNLSSFVLEVARDDTAVYGVKVEQFGINYTSKVYGLIASLTEKSFSETLILDTEGSSDIRNFVSDKVKLTSFGGIGPLLKLARFRYTINLFGKVDKAYISIINFLGSGFERHDQEETDAEALPNRDFPRNLGSATIRPETNTFANVITAKAANFRVIGSPAIGKLIESEYQAEGEYFIVESTANTFRPSFPTYSQTGKEITDVYFGSSSDSAGNIIDPFCLIEFDSKEPRVIFEIPDGYTGYNILPHIDSITKNIYIYSKNNLTDYVGLLEYDTNGAFIKEIPLVRSYLAPMNGKAYNSQNFIIIDSPLNQERNATILYIKAYNVLIGEVTLYELLKREGAEFSTIRTDFLNIRLDNSLSSPLISVDDVLKTTSITRNYQDGFTFTNMVTDGELENKRVEDFRYTNTNVLPISGYGSTFVYSNLDGIHFVPIETGLALERDEIVFTPASGVVSRVETTNYKLPGQYIFATTSGTGTFSFFQANPETADTFIEYNLGFPINSTPTRIRVDDRI